MIRWMAARRYYFGLSFVLLLLALASFLWQRPPLGLEFRGGTQIVIASETQPEHEQAIGIRSLGNQRYELLFPSLSAEEQAAVLTDLAINLEQTDLQPEQITTVGSSVSNSMIKQSLSALALALLAILAYVGWQFKDWRMGLAAVAAMLHDSFITLGAYLWLAAFFGFEIDLLLITALLTVLSFSVHDTIVVFDQTREQLRINGARLPALSANQAITLTLPRSLNNSLTIIIVLAALLIWGGESLQSFTTTLLIGSIIGTYSSTFVALPLWLEWSRSARFSHRAVQ